MKGMGCLNGNLQHATSEKPRESPTATFTHRPSIYQAGIVSIWSLAVEYDTEALYNVCKRSDMSLKWVGWFNHFPTHTTSESPRESPTATEAVTGRPSIYQAGIE
jgi:hypothetical protein